MTTTIKSERVYGYSISIEQEKYSNGYTVTACEIFEGNLCGYPLKENYYGTLDKAKRRYSNLKRMAKKGEI